MEIPTITQIQRNLLSSFKRELNIETPVPNSILYIISYVVAGALYGCYYFAQNLINNLFLDKTTDHDVIKAWGSSFMIPPFESKAATGNVTVTGNGSILKGNILINSVGHTYSTAENVTITTQGTIKVWSTDHGKHLNLLPGSELIFQTPIQGINAAVVVDAQGLTGGDDAEDIEDYRNRILGRLRSIRTGGSKQDYIDWAQEVGGVGKVFVIEKLGGALGQIGIFFTTNDRTNLIPNADLVKRVADIIDKNQPLGSVVNVSAPTKKPIDLRLEISPDTEEIRRNIIANIQEMFKVNAELGGEAFRGKVYYSKVSEAISLAEGEFSHTLETFPDLELGNNEIATLGTITDLSGNRWENEGSQA